MYFSCKGFNMDYNRNECQSVTANSEANLFNLRLSTGIAFFEAICLRGKLNQIRKIQLKMLLQNVYLTF